MPEKITDFPLADQATAASKIAWLLHLADRHAEINTHGTHALTRMTHGFSLSGIFGLWGVELLNEATGQRLAKAGFDYHANKNSIEITHTPQGLAGVELTNPDRRELNRCRAFRTFML